MTVSILDPNITHLSSSRVVCCLFLRSYDNIQVFRGVVKMRRGQTAHLMRSCRSMADVFRVFRTFAQDIQAKCVGFRATSGGAENKRRTIELTHAIIDLCNKGEEKLIREGKAYDMAADEPIPVPVRVALFALFLGYFCYAWGLGGVRQAMGVTGVVSGGLVLFLQQAMSLVFLAFFTYVLITGQRIGTPNDV